MISILPVLFLGLVASANAVPLSTDHAKRQSFALSNGQAAQALNKKFASLTADSPCSNENACVKGQFAQCVAGKFVTTGCAGGLQCFALPLVNSAGTSITCTTEADAQARIERTGATGGIEGDGSAAAPAPAPAPATPAPAAPAQAAPAAGSGSGGSSSGFALSNGQAAQALNKKFAGLSASSPCSSGDNACINSQFAQCVGGKFVTTGCAGGLQCFALPLVNSAGTSITCTTEADALARIERTGATGGIQGDSSAAPPSQPAAPATPAPAPATPAPVNNAPAPAAPATGGAAVAPASCPKNRKREFFSPRGSSAGFEKRAAQQDLTAVAQSWQNLCVKSGGNISGADQPCVTLAGINGINALLAGAPPCAQQNNADAMIDFAKSAGVTNKDALIANAIAYRKHPRNTINLGGFTPSTPFCQTAPRNAELNGVANAQLADGNPGLFGGPNFPVVAFGAPESCPFGQKPNVASCTCN